jgi:tol-pal system protein YbgF
MSAGNSELALQQFQDFLKSFGTTEMAPNAQFYIGQINYNKGQLDSALQAFDAVLEKYTDNNKTADAMYMKGKTLLRLEQRTAAAEEFREVIKRFPSSDVAPKARAELKSLGLSPTGSPASKKRSR